MRATTDFAGGNGAPLVNKMIGDAFLTVKAVADNINDVKYVAYNMQAVITLATLVEQLATRVGTLETEVAALKAK